MGNEGKMAEEGTHEELLAIPVERDAAEGGAKPLVVSGFYHDQWTSMMGTGLKEEPNASETMASEDPVSKEAQASEEPDTTKRVGSEEFKAMESRITEMTNLI